MSSVINAFYNDKESVVEFQEFVCRRKENKRRIVNEVIEAKYICYQMRQQISIYHDVYGAPVNVTVNRKNGCELRCINKNCE